MNPEIVHLGWIAAWCSLIIYLGRLGAWQAAIVIGIAVITYNLITMAIPGPYLSVWKCRNQCLQSEEQAINDLGFFVSIVSSAMHNNSQIVRLLILSNESNRCVWENGDLGHRNECVKKRVDICEVRGLFKQVKQK